MKAKLQAKIVEIVKNIKSESEHFSISHAGMTKMKIVSTEGKVETNLNNAQTVLFNGDLIIKQIIADQMKIGATFTITISDEESDERLD